MRLIKSHPRLLTFQLNRTEHRALVDLLTRFPAVPPGHHRLSRSESKPEDQELLDQSHANLRRAHRRKIRAFLASGTRFHEIHSGWTLSIKPDQIDWLLQVLNDIRIGSWIALGSPDGPQETIAALTPKTVPHFHAMEAAALFQILLLSALKSAPPST